MSYLLDGNNLKTTFGISIAEGDGRKGFYDLPKRKNPVEYNWEDSDGVEAYTDADDIVFEARNLRLHCTIVGVSTTDLEEKISNFKSLIMQSGLRTLLTPYSSESFSVYFVKAYAFKLQSKLTDSGQVAGSFVLHLREPNPKYITKVSTPVIVEGAPASYNITITCPTFGVSIYYTTDGSVPDSTDTLYTVPFSNVANDTIKAIAYHGIVTSSVESYTR